MNLFIHYTTLNICGNGNRIKTIYYSQCSFVGLVSPCKPQLSSLKQHLKKILFEIHRYNILDKNLYNYVCSNICLNTDSNNVRTFIIISSFSYFQVPGNEGDFIENHFP